MIETKILWSAEHLNMMVGRQLLFEDAALAIGAGERVAMVGRNGAGKSTLMRIIAGEEQPTSGEISVPKELRVAMMPQEYHPAPGETTVGRTVREGLAYFEGLHQRFESLPINCREHVQVEAELNHYDAWNLENKFENIATRLHLPPEDADLAVLSGGELRRVMLARAIVAEPDILLLDEPTNHIDIDTVTWIEDFLTQYRGACFIITHDRYFLDRIATRIVELDHGKIYSAGASYSEYLETKAEREYAEDAEAEKRRSFLRREQEWVRRTPKARTRRDQGRLRKYEEIAAISGPQRIGDIDLVIPQPSRLGNKVIDLKNVTLSFGERQLLKDFSYSLTADQKVGILGANGMGKTSLLKLITGELQPNSGEVKVAETVVFNYVDQSRVALNPDRTVAEEVSDDLDFVKLGSEKISIWTYLKRFMFEDERIRTQVRYLSGGEKARLILAKLLKQGGNVIILDEPTNDLDLPTLRVLEEALIDYPSAMLIVSHDRFFLNRVCNRIIAFDGDDGHPTVGIGNFDYYSQKRREMLAEQEKAKKLADNERNGESPSYNGQVRKNQRKHLTYKDALELERLEAEIPSAEDDVAKLEAEFADPELFAKRPKEVPAVQRKLEEAKAILAAKYARWEELAALKEQLENG